MKFRFKENDRSGIYQHAFLSPAGVGKLMLPESAVHPSSAVPVSGHATGIELRMRPPFIRDNHTLRFWPFPGRARLYCLTMVVSDTENQLTGAIDLSGFPGVGDKEYLPINKTIYYWQSDDKSPKAPNQVHVMCAIIKSKEALRDTGDILSQAKYDQEYRDVIGQLSDVVADAASFNLVAQLSLQVAGIVGRYLGRVRDRPIGTVISSFTRLHGDWDRMGVNALSIPTRDVDFNLELIIRDASRLPPYDAAATPQAGLVAASMMPL